MKFLQLILENSYRNLIRTLLTALGTIVLVAVVTLVWSVLEFLQKATEEKNNNIKAIVSERWSLPSQMPFAYATTLSEGAADKNKSGDILPEDSMTWTFYGGSTEKEAKLRAWDNICFAFCLEPRALGTMMDELDSLPPPEKAAWTETVTRLQQNPQGIIMGKNKLASLKKQIGDRFTLHGLNYKEIDLEVEVVGTFPVPRYDNSCAIDIAYFLRAIDAYPQTHAGKQHPMAEKTLNLVWLRVPDTEAFNKIATQITTSPYYSNPAVKVETSSSGIATFLEAYRDLIWGMRWLLGPAIIITLALVISNAISISVRERRMEFAILKVLGFSPAHILVLVLGEALLVGVIAGGLSAGTCYFLVNRVMGGVPFPIAFFPKFAISDWAPFWGVLIGAGAALLGSFLPAWNACRVKVSEVFARVA
jgi:putative ABC transport system permease protein